MGTAKNGLARSVSAAFGIGMLLSFQTGWAAGTGKLLNEQELDSISAGSTALASAMALGFGNYISGSISGTNTGALNVSNGFAGVSGAGAGAGAGAGGDGGGTAATSATTGSGPVSIGTTMSLNLGNSGPGGIATGISTSLTAGLTYTSLL